MKRASITDAKNRLSALIDRVRHGDTIVIEDRGVPVARLESVTTAGGDASDGRLARLEREGLVRRAVAPPPKLPPPPRPERPARPSELVIAERRGDR